MKIQTSQAKKWSDLLLPVVVSVTGLCLTPESAAADRAAPESLSQPAPPGSPLMDEGLADLDAPDSDLAALPPAPNPHEIGVSADFLYGKGDVTVPLNFALAPLDPELGLGLGVFEPDRSSTYFGGTLSYSFGQKWHFDFSVASGSSSGDVSVPVSRLASLPSEFSIDDTWLQFYVRYAIPLSNTRYSIYARAGVTYVTAELEVESLPNPALPGTGYSQSNETEDIRGNLGFGGSYAFYTSPSLWIAAQLEGEVYVGGRFQESFEERTIAGTPASATADIDNFLWGGIGRATVRTQYNFRGIDARAFLDFGVQANMMAISYSEGGSFGELLWGPYVKIGFQYAFGGARSR
jgi:hypothetical protein